MNFARTIAPSHPINQSAFPRTRYQGSKRSLAEAIVQAVAHLDFDSVLDAFGGTGSMAYAFKRAGKAVTHNDVLLFNHQIGLALVENNDVTLMLCHLPERVASLRARSDSSAHSKHNGFREGLTKREFACADNDGLERACEDDDDLTLLGRRHPGRSYDNFIERTFEDIYFTSAENKWLDVAIQNIGAMKCPMRRALAWFSLGQAALVKRPFNLFHRRNLYLRTADVKRGFGNKKSWDRSFPDHMAKFSREANEAVFDSGRRCRAMCRDVLEIKPAFDLVYLDPPYVNKKGVAVNYRGFYHFLEGMLQYDIWPTLIDAASLHRRLRPIDNPWCDPKRNLDQFRKVLHRFSQSIIVLSYRDNGLPTIEELVALVRSIKPHVHVMALSTRPYALSTSGRSHEMLILGH